MNRRTVFLLSWTVLLLTPQLFAQAFSGDSVRAMRDTIVIVGTRSTLLSPATELSQRDLFSSPGGFHDPLRAVTRLPSAAPSSDLQAQPSIGGDDPDRVLTLLDGFDIIAPYRFLGAFSVFNPLMIRSVNATATGYSVRYGGFFPSAIEVQSDNEYVENAFASAEFMLPVSQIVVGLPLDKPEGLSARVGLRTSHLSALRPVFSAFAKDRDVDGFLPNMRDVQWNVTFSPSTLLRVRETGIVADENGSLQSFERTFSYSWKRVFQGVTLAWQPDRNWNVTTRISLHNNDADLSSVFPLESLGGQTFAMSSFLQQAKIVSEADIEADPSLSLHVGGEFARKRSEQSFGASSEYLRVPPPAASSFNEAAFFAEAKTRPWNLFEVTFGERMWYSGFISRWGNDVRLDAGAWLFDVVRVEAGFGEYSQPPSDAQVSYGYLSLLAQPNQPPRLLLMSQSKAPLAPEMSKVLFARVYETFSVSPSVAGLVNAEIYRKKESAVILSQRYPSVFTPLDSNSFQPSQRFEGDKWGIGLSLLLSDASSGLSASASYARQSSEVRNAAAGTVVPAGSDRHHLWKAMIKMDSEAWNIAVTYQYFSGLPATDRTFLQSTGMFGNTFFVPVWSSLNSSRLPPYSRLDLSVSKTFDAGSWAVTPYVDIVNVLNAKNVSGYGYTLNETKPPGYANENPEYNSFPFFPMVGVRLKKEW